jgi:hypothetical protein
LRQLFAAMVRWAEASTFPLAAPWRPPTVQHRKIEAAALTEGIDQDHPWPPASERRRIKRWAAEAKALSVSTQTQVRQRLPLAIAVMAARWLKRHFNEDERKSKLTREHELQGILPGQAGIIAGIVLDREAVPGDQAYERLRYEGREKLRQTVRDSRS